MSFVPQELSSIPKVELRQEDDLLITAASWESRCLGLPRLLSGYRCRQVLVTVYDGKSSLREKHIQELDRLFDPIGPVEHLPASHADSIPHVREVLDRVKQVVANRAPQISIDISTFTRKHLLQLLQGLDVSGLLTDCRLFYTEPLDYDTQDDEPFSEGITSVRTIETFAGQNLPSQDSLLVIFLGYEGRRALALWEHLEPNVTIAVIPDPPFHVEWLERTESQNRYLLSCLPPERIFRTHSRNPLDSDNFLARLMESEEFSRRKYNYRIAPLGTKCQVIGIYRFVRQCLGVPSLVYARPSRYREERAALKPGRTWLLDNTKAWPSWKSGYPNKVTGT